MRQLEKPKFNIQESTAVKAGLNFIKSHSFPGFMGVPIYNILIFIVNEIRRQRIMFRANSIAFSFFVSIFPAIIVIINLLAYIPIEGIIETLNSSLASVLPATAHSFLFDTINDIVDRPRAGLLSISFLLAVFISSNGMMAMMHSFDKSHEVSFKRRTGFQKRMRSIWLTSLLAILLILSISFIIAGRAVLQWLADTFTGLPDASTTFLSLTRWISLAFLFYTFISLIYRYGPALNRKTGFFSAGTTLATLLSILTSILFSLYVNNFGTYNTVYGSIGAIIVLLLWIQINAFILLIGFELNASITVNRDLKKLREVEGDVVD